MTPATGEAVTRPRILVIEDEPSVASFMRTALERHGYDVVPSPSAAMGLQLLATGDFRGVVSDFRTPGGINGADLHDWLQRHRPELAGRIVFITGDTANDETISLLSRVATTCIEKPFRVHEFLAAVDKTIGKP